MIRIGCIIPGGSFMPEGDQRLSSAYKNLLGGTKFILNSGFDYAEASVGMIMELSDSETENLAGQVQLEVANCFIPGSYKLMENPLSPEAFVEKAMSRMRLLGIDTVVFGSGGARKVPADMPKEKALEQIYRFIQMCEKYAAQNHITVALEPLNAPEAGCKFMNRVDECYEMQQHLNLPHIKVLADIFHMGIENESFDVFGKVGADLAHVHFAERKRTYPGSVDDGFVAEAAKALRDCGYNKRVTAECSFGDFEKDAAQAAAFMKKVLCTES